MKNYRKADCCQYCDNMDFTMDEEGGIKEFLCMASDPPEFLPFLEYVCDDFIECADPLRPPSEYIRNEVEYRRNEFVHHRSRNPQVHPVMRDIINKL